MPQRNIPLYINTRIINIKSLANPKWFKKQLDPDAFYSSIQDVFASFGPPYGAADNKIIPNGFFWSSLAINCTFTKSRILQRAHSKSMQQ